MDQPRAGASAPACGSSEVFEGDPRVFPLSRLDTVARWASDGVGRQAESAALLQGQGSGRDGNAAARCRTRRPGDGGGDDPSRNERVHKNKELGNELRNYELRG